MKRAVQVISVSREVLAELPLASVKLPPETWIVRGPRGGHYLAIGARERFLTETADDFIRDQATVVDRSEGVRYLRPEQAARLA